MIKELDTVKSEEEFEIPTTIRRNYFVQSPFRIFRNGIPKRVYVKHVHKFTRINKDKGFSYDDSDVAYIEYDEVTQKKEKKFVTATTFINMYKFRVPERIGA